MFLLLLLSKRERERERERKRVENVSVIVKERERERGEREREERESKNVQCYCWQLFWNGIKETNVFVEGIISDLPSSTSTEASSASSKWSRLPESTPSCPRTTLKSTWKLSVRTMLLTLPQTRHFRL